MSGIDLVIIELPRPSPVFPPVPSNPSAFIAMQARFSAIVVFPFIVGSVSSPLGGFKGPTIS